MAGLMIPWLRSPLDFPPVSQALAQPNGLLAAGGAVTPAYLIPAYRAGIFPWYLPEEPILWWSPAPRMVLFPDELHIPRSLAKVMRNRSYTIRYDTAFLEVMESCAAPRQGESGTWISDEILRGYAELHFQGYAHSIETWIDGELAGGLYGVAMGSVFYGESMFARRPDASKIAFAHGVPWLAQQGFKMIDCQMYTDHLNRFGAREISRAEFSANLEKWVNIPRTPSPWRYQYIHTGRHTNE